jgi:hypothetical protein
MIRVGLAAGAAALAVSAPQQPQQPPASLPGFAPTLAQMPVISGPAGWQGVTGAEAWHALTFAKPAERQAARWRYALGLIAQGHASEAFGVLEVMRADDPDLALTSSFRLARGATLTLLRRNRDAIDSLSGADLAANPEACLWRMRAFAEDGDARNAVGEMRCALPALNARPAPDRGSFLLAGAAAAIDAGAVRQGQQWLAILPDGHPAANLLRARAMLATHDLAGARIGFERAAQASDPEVAADARLGSIETALAAATIKPAQALTRIDDLRFAWRGGAVEARALRLEFRLASEAHDLRASLRTGAALVRYFPLGKEAAPMLAQLHAMLATALGPDSGLPIADAAGLYWDYRELAPVGAEGDLLALHLADRLQEAGLYARAAELVQYQLTQRAADVAQGPLSIKVAALQILAGAPQRALDALRGSEQAGYTDAMRWDRKRMEAVALQQLGKKDAAIAALDGVPDADAIRAEIEWRAKDWNAFVADTEHRLPPPRILNDPARATVLRHAVALAMLGREDRLAALRARYVALFKDGPGADAFDVLTSAIGSVNPASLGAAMASIPAASPPASIGDLLDAGD